MFSPCTVAIIPARLNSSRLPKKLLENLGPYSVLQTTYLNTLKSALIDEVWIATDSQEIKEHCLTFTDNILLTEACESGSERIAKAVASNPRFSGTSFIVNVCPF